MANGRAGKMPAIPLGRTRCTALLRRDVGPQAGVELARRQHRDEEEGQDPEGEDVDHHGEPHRGLDADDVDPHEDHVEDRPPGTGLFHQGEPAMSNSPAMMSCVRKPIAPTTTAGVMTYSMFSASPVMNPPQGPMAERANEYAPGVGQGRRHLGDAVARAEVHDRDDHGREQQPAEPAGVEPQGSTRRSRPR